jgi:hypothetical protein
MRQSQNQFKVTADVDGTQLGIFDTFAGGEVDSDEVRYRPGGMGAPISIGGAVTVNNVTIGRMYDLQVDGSLIIWLIGRVGKGTITVKKLPLDADGNAYGRALTYKGVLKQVTPPAHDSNSSDPAVIELEMVPGGTVT